ncbi:unnamed protein product [Schistocephalus solidus]|uniref:G_PROTEIN_RECEP_F1_2 domain-containing protein n=1 Tax=Schistocephalus solidus TaxID=70667 RepID=A0A183SVF0_SCHSO|nr:unnamed protein product [Schistocephalus solidus]
MLSHSNPLHARGGKRNDERRGQQFSVMELKKSTAEVANLFKCIMMVYIGGPIIVMGIITSILSLLMFKRDTATSSATRLLLSTIAATDILFLVCCFIFWTVKEIFSGSPTLVAFLNSPFVYGFLFYICNVFELQRNWLVVVLAVERLLFFLKPLEFKSIWSLSRVRGIIILVILLSCLFRIPVLIYGIAKHDASLDPAVARLTKLIHSLTDCILLTILPVTVMAVLSTLTAARVRAVIETKRRLDNDCVSSVAGPSMPSVSHSGAVATEAIKEQKKEGYASNCSADKAGAQTHNRVIKILHTVLITFIIFCSPAVVSTTVHAYVAFHKITSGPVDVVSKILAPISNVGSLLNSTSNFFVYIIQSRRYQKIIAEMLMLDRCGLKKFLKVTNKPAENSSG